MEKVKIDTGIQSFKLSTGGVLRFNPSDPNLYTRFENALDKLQQIQDDLVDQVRAMEHDDGAGVLRLMSQADGRMKAVLSQVFGKENDFDELLGGVNLLAVATNGQRVAANLFAALEAILIQGVERCAKEEAKRAKAQPVC